MELKSKEIHWAGHKEINENITTFWKINIIKDSKVYYVQKC